MWQKIVLIAATLGSSSTALAQGAKPLTGAEAKYQYPVATKVIFMQLCSINSRAGDTDRDQWFMQFAQTHAYRGLSLYDYIRRNGRYPQMMRNPVMKAQVCGTYKRDEAKIRAELEREVGLMKAAHATH